MIVHAFVCVSYISQLFCHHHHPTRDCACHNALFWHPTSNRDVCCTYLNSLFLIDRGISTCFAFFSMFVHFGIRQLTGAWKGALSRKPGCPTRPWSFSGRIDISMDETVKDCALALLQPSRPSWPLFRSFSSRIE